MQKKVILHTMQLSHRITVYQRSCDFCEELTPLPTKEQFDQATIVAITSGIGNLVPCIADGFEGLVSAIDVLRDFHMWTAVAALVETYGFTEREFTEAEYAAAAFQPRQA